jgi:tetratricopeptide (TPR) repeat protein
MRRLVLPAAAELDRGLLSELRGDEKVYVNNMPKLMSMFQAIRAGNDAQAIGIYKSLPTELREQKTVLVVHLKAAQSDDAEYSAALATYRRLYPTDPGVDFLSIDYHVLKKNYDEAIRCVDKVDMVVGGDPFLLTVRANVLAEAGRFEQARTASEKAIEQEPELKEGYWSRISVALKEKNHADTLKWLKRVVEKTSVEIADLTTEDDYADFVKSPQHEEWLKWYGRRKK